jgi:(4-(4-[2-(gamma-L-glutamylamino)ethyl]phenoxymethyl)furan-2-yl)methanamine synthase
MKIAGFDIGGANTDLAVIDFDSNGNINQIETSFMYLPMWQKKEQLGSALKELLRPWEHEIDAVGVSMTAELVDAYKTKIDGVLDISKKSYNSFQVPIGFVGLDGIMEISEVTKYPMKVAAANWIATAPLAAKINPNSVLIDTGSTTTDIIPIKNGNECAKGRSDLERLKTGELVYSGTLRTNVATLTEKVPINDKMTRVSSELFAVTADVQIVLGNINEEQYSCDTMDGAGKSLNDCMRRISRVVCGDLEVLSRQEIKSISEHIYSAQIKRISEALREVSKRNKLSHVVTTGLGMDIIGAEASKLAGLKYTGMDKLLKKEDCVVAPAVGTAILMEQFLRNKQKYRI